MYQLTTQNYFINQVNEYVQFPLPNDGAYKLNFKTHFNKPPFI